jgi:lysophospholipase L1-like esterase
MRDNPVEFSDVCQLQLENHIKKTWGQMMKTIFRCAQFLLTVGCIFGWNAELWAQQSPIAQSSMTPGQLLRESKTTIFLGDSITAAGQYIGFLELWIASQKWDKQPKIIDMGLPSETVSGLSEDGHAGGKFPRPDLAERLDRVLAIAKPDLVFACYGINCGIYEPFDEGRFERYQQGYRNLKQKVEATGAKFVVITPPFYDDLRKPLGGFSYNEVLDKYSQWLVAQRQAGWQVIDLHSAMTAEILAKRKANPIYTVQPDGVHPDGAGHWCVARHLINGLGGKLSNEATIESFLADNNSSSERLEKFQKRVGILRDAYVGTAGHKRPGIAKGLAIDEAEKQAEQIEAALN